jgi:hypothetical protein
MSPYFPPETQSLFNIGRRLSAAAAATTQVEPAIVDAARNVRGIVAQRGSSADRPENTMAAYRRAIESGTTGIEVDRRLTHDGHLVSLHIIAGVRSRDQVGFFRHRLPEARQVRLD